MREFYRRLPSLGVAACRRGSCRRGSELESFTACPLRAGVSTARWGQSLNLAAPESWRRSLPGARKIQALTPIPRALPQEGEELAGETRRVFPVERMTHAGDDHGAGTLDRGGDAALLVYREDREIGRAHV